MIHRIKKNIKIALSLAFVSFALAACSKWDDFKEYTENGEISYTGKLDSVKIMSGNNRVKIKGQLKADPNISKVRVYWNDYKDSVEFAVDQSSGSRVFEKTFAVEEGIKSFVIYTFDAKGNKSIAVNAVGQSYGSRYQNSLNQRLVGSAATANGKTEVVWLTMDLSAGPFATEVKYMSSTGEKIIRVPITAETTELTNIAATAKSFSYRTLYLPQKTSIDTFYTDYKNVGIFKDVTSEYLQNTQVPVATTVKGDRWGIPSNWTTNAAARNFRQSPGVFYGGVDYWFGGPFLAMEAGWSADNMVTITNGKIYQSPILDPGTYTLEMDIPDCTANGEFYTVAAAGAEIPDIENITSSLGYAKTNTKGTNKISFKVTTRQMVSLGFVGNLPNKGAGDGTFWRITGVRLKQLPMVN